MVSGGNDFETPKIMNQFNLKYKFHHDLDNEIGAEDLHFLQLTKEIINYFMQIRLLRHGQYFTEMSLSKAKCG